MQTFRPGTGSMFLCYSLGSCSQQLHGCSRTAERNLIAFLDINHFESSMWHKDCQSSNHRCVFIKTKMIQSGRLTSVPMSKPERISPYPSFFFGGGGPTVYAPHTPHLGGGRGMMDDWIMGMLKDTEKGIIKTARFYVSVILTTRWNNLNM